MTAILKTVIGQLLEPNNLSYQQLKYHFLVFNSLQVYQVLARGEKLERSMFKQVKIRTTVVSTGKNVHPAIKGIYL